MAWKILGTGSAILAGIAATKVADQIWQRAGHEKFDPKNPNASVYTALVYAALTGVAAGIARTLATRKAASYYAKSTGHLPKDIKDQDL